MQDREDLQNYVLHPHQYISEGQRYACDLNGDGLVDESDLGLLDELLLIETEPVSPEVDIEDINYVVTIQLQHQLSGTQFPQPNNTGLDVAVEYGETSYFHILHTDSLPTTANQQTLLEWGLVQISSFSAVFTTGGTFTNIDFDMSGLVGWYLKIGLEWCKIEWAFSIESGGDTYTAISVKRGLFANPNTSLENNYDPTAVEPYAHDVGEDIRIYSDHPVFEDESTEEDNDG